MAFGTLSFFDNFDRSSTNIQCATCISTDGAHFACCVTNGFQIKCVYTLKTRSDNFAKLLVRIWLEINSSETFETTTALKYVVESQWQCILPIRLETLLVSIRSGKSIVFAMATTISRESGRLGHSKKLYITVCFFVTIRSNSSIKTTLWGV